MAALASDGSVRKIIIVNELNKFVYYKTLMHTNRQGRPPEGGSGSAQKETNKFVSYN